MRYLVSLLAVIFVVLLAIIIFGCTPTQEGDSQLDVSVMECDVIQQAEQFNLSIMDGHKTWLTNCMEYTAQNMADDYVIRNGLALCSILNDHLIYMTSLDTRIKAAYTDKGCKPTPE